MEGASDALEDPLSENIIRLRKWDDGAKVVGTAGKTPRISVYDALIEGHLRGDEKTTGREP